MLTDRAIRALKAREKPYKRSDEKGLYLLINPTGSKYWRLKYRYAGKEKVLALGVYPDVTLVEARDGRDDAKRLLKAGEDPVATGRRRKREKESAHANTFEAIAREWAGKQRWTPAHTDRVLRSLEQDIFPEIGSEPISTITAQDLLAVLRKAEKRGVTETVHRLLQRCGAIFRYGVASGYCPSNPGADLRGALTPHKAKNQLALTVAELPEFLQKLEAYDGRPETRIGLRLLALTFVRPGELRAAEWSEFNLEAPEWRIPAERMQMGDEHVVPLSRQAVEALNELHSLTGRSRFLFPNQSNHEKCMSENTLLFALYRMGYHNRATAHGFRATASTALNEQGWRPDVIERQLAHAERNKTRAAYNRASYLAERREMMQAWADYLNSLTAGGNVVSGRFGTA